MPYSVARSSATTSAAFFSQCGSSNCFLSRWPAHLLQPLRLNGAQPRPNRRVVSTSSAATIQRPGFLVEVGAGVAHRT